MFSGGNAWNPAANATTGATGGLGAGNPFGGAVTTYGSQGLGAARRSYGEAALMEVTF